MRRIASPLVLAVMVTAWLGGDETGWRVRSAEAQDPPTVLTPGAGQAAEPAPAPAPASSEPIILQVPGATDGSAPAEDESGFYYYDDLDGGQGSFGDPLGGEPIYGPVPPLHVVRRGDTLWDICWFYFNNPWEWPKIWSYNPSITNPHWIYPGDLVRLYPQGLGAAVDPAVDPEASPGEPSSEPDLEPTPGRRYNVSLRQIAFVDRDDLDVAATIVGAVEEKELLSRGDAVYLDYKRPPTVGKRYAIYTDATPVTHPDSKEEVGAYVRILGELEVVSVKKDKRARAIITDSIDVIERGDRVGPLQRTFRTVEPQRNEKDLQGTIVAMIGSEALIGQGQLVFVDKGQRDGLKVGNRMFVVRRGDALDTVVRRPDSSVGKDDRRFPARALGEIIVVQTGKNISVALVTLTLRDIGVGDKVLMRKASP